MAIESPEKNDYPKIVLLDIDLHVHGAELLQPYP